MIKLVWSKEIKWILFQFMLDTVKNGKSAEIDCKKKAWIQNLKNIKNQA